MFLPTSSVQQTLFDFLHFVVCSIRVALLRIGADASICGDGLPGMGPGLSRDRPETPTHLWGGSCNVNRHLIAELACVEVAVSTFLRLASSYSLLVTILIRHLPFGPVLRLACRANSYILYWHGMYGPLQDCLLDGVCSFYPVVASVPI